MCEIALRADGGDFLLITIMGRSHPDALDYWDGNWILAEVEVKGGGFHGNVKGDLRSEEFADFQTQLTILQEKLRGEAEFRTMENWLSIQIVGDGMGHMKCRCLVCDQPGIGNLLDFAIHSDQTFTRRTLADLHRVLTSFPVVGSI